MSGNFRKLTMLGVLILFAGCVSVPIESSFESVQKDVSDRTGYDIEWQGVSTPAEAVDEIVADLLEDGLTAGEAAHIALLENPRLQAVYEGYGIARAELVKASLPDNPLFTGELVYEDSSSQSWELEVAQNLQSILLIPLRRSVAKTELERAAAEVAAAVIDVTMDTRRAFLHYQADVEMFDQWTDLLLAEEAMFEMTVKMREAGNIPQSDVAAAQGRYEDAKLAYAAAELDLEASRERVNRLMGLYGPAATWEVAEGLAMPPPETSFETDVEQRAVENSLDLAMAWLDTRAAARRAGISNVDAIFPEFGGGVKFESAEPESGSRVWEVGPVAEISIPLFDQGQPARAIGRGEVRAAWDLYTALAIELRSATRAALHKTNVTYQSARYDHQVNLPVARHRMDQAQRRYNGMFIGPIDLLRVKQQEIQAEMSYVQSELAYWLARTDLEQILLGRLVVRAPEDRPDIIGADIQQAAMNQGGGH